MKSGTGNSRKEDGLLRDGIIAVMLLGTHNVINLV